jgi:aminopeptidase N
MRSLVAPTIRRADYQPPSYRASHIDLRFELNPSATTVVAKTRITRMDKGAKELVLNGEALTLVDLKLDGLPVEPRFTDEDLLISLDKDEALLEVVTRLNPAANTTLMGLYVSGGNYFTQCEAQGFRRITYALDRPDVMARYQVLMLAPAAQTPVLLSNGNLMDQAAFSDRWPQGLVASELAHINNIDQWHWALWQDPFPKPTYLFALVAGDLVAQQETMMVGSPARPALLQVWVQPGNEQKTDYAMQSLKKAIAWDEKRFGLSLDLDRFMIVAVSDFNMGAMENKGLNVFNTKYVFANPAIATDVDFGNVEAVVGHEYFHNWTGNRVTCRDWFQLTLKEGLTVFRDQEFSADMLANQAASPTQAASAKAVKRIDDVKVLRSAQFAEDAGPMAHPIRPESYQEINNFYTVTVYEKGAEVIRMMHTLVGEAGFRRGMDLYFQRHDGQAVTCDDFVAALADANQIDLEQFKRWYSQAGTPQVSLTEQWDAGSGMLELHFQQSCEPSPGQSSKQAFDIPIALGLLDAQGQDLLQPATPVFRLTQAQQTLRYGPYKAKPYVSALRGFSAPVKLNHALSDTDLAFLAAHDTDPFNRWEAGQRLATGAILAVLAGVEPAIACAALGRAFGAMLDSDSDPAYQELFFGLPSEGYIAEQLAQVDPFSIRMARNAVRAWLADTFVNRWATLYKSLAPNWLDPTAASQPYSPDPASAGRRALANCALSYWASASAQNHSQQAFDLAVVQLQKATNLTDRSAALMVLILADDKALEPAKKRTLLADFAHEFSNEALVLDKWFMMQALAQKRSSYADTKGTLDLVKQLMLHPQFNLQNPNRARALIGSFCHGNLAEFHLPDGSGYTFWADQVIALNDINPQVAARLARAMDRWKKFPPELAQAMQAALQRVAQHPNLSPDVQEIISKALQS